MRVQSIGDYYTLQGAAEALGVSYWQVWRAVRQRQTPTLSLGATLLVLLDDVEAALGLRSNVPEKREAARPATSYRVLGQVCPQCESATLVREEGCQKCYSCGYAVC